jgi:ATP:ADP antiporter, AAA family
MRLPAQLFERAIDIRKTELARVLLMSTYLLLIIASYSVTKAVRDSLFVTKIGPARLPYVYLLIAGAMGLVSIVYSRAVNRIGLHRLIRTTSLIAMSNLLLFWLLFRNDRPIWFYVLYVWVSLFGVITASQFWLLATHVFNAREARRVFTWIGVGGILGGALGGGLTNRMAHLLGTESLLIVCAVMMAGTVVLLEALGDGWAAPSSPLDKNEKVIRQVWESRHLTTLAALLCVAVIVEAFIDYQYKVVAAHSIASKDHLTAFFGSVTFYIGVCSLLFQTLITNRILRRFGVGWAILLLPIGLLVAFVALAARPVLWAAALLQLVDGTFSYSIHRSGMELLYLPIPPQTRNAVKGFIDTFVDRAGRAAGALILLLCTAALALSIPALSIIAAGLAGAWIVMAIVVKRSYLQSFRQALQVKTIDAEALQIRNLDSATMKTLLALLSSEDERQVLYALDLLGGTHPNRWRGYIDLLVQHRSSAVRARTIAVLASWNDPALVREEFIRHSDYETARVATASALRLHWNGSRQNGELLNSLLCDGSPMVVREAIVTAGIVRHEEAVPLLIDMLAEKTLRNDARTALINLEDVVIPILRRRLAHPEEVRAIRRQIPKTLALTMKQEAADALMESLSISDLELNHAVLRALNRMRTTTAAIVVDRELILDAIEKERQRYERLRGIHAWLNVNRESDRIFSLLIRAVGERIEQRLERIFRFVALIYPPHDIYSVYYSWQAKPALRPAAIEFLDNIVDEPIKGLLLPLLEEGPSRPMHFISLRAGLLMIADSEDAWLKTIAQAALVACVEGAADERRYPSVIAY